MNMYKNPIPTINSCTFFTKNSIVIQYAYFGINDNSGKVQLLGSVFGSKAGTIAPIAQDKLRSSKRKEFGDRNILVPITIVEKLNYWALFWAQKQTLAPVAQDKLRSSKRNSQTRSSFFMGPNHYLLSPLHTGPTHGKRARNTDPAQCDLTNCSFFISIPHHTLHRGAFCPIPFRWIYYYGSNKSTGEETGKMHLCALGKYLKKQPEIEGGPRLLQF